jgi:FkbM family methyltransferase
MSEFDAIRTKELRPVVIRGETFQVAKEPADFWGWVDNDKWEPYLFTFLKMVLTPETTLIDIGAWVGPATLYAARLCKKVYALEPDPVAYDILRTNIEANWIMTTDYGRNIETFPLAIMSHLGKVSLGASGLGCSVSRTSCIDNSFSAPCTSVSAFVEEHKISGPLVIKIDVEGAEDRVFLDPFFLEHKPTLIVSLHPAWWAEAGKNVDGTRAAIMKVANRYKYQYNAARSFCDLNEFPDVSELVLSDTAL